MKNLLMLMSMLALPGVALAQSEADSGDESSDPAEEAKDEAEEAKDEAEEAKDEAEEAKDEATEAADEAVEGATDAVEEAVEGAADTAEEAVEEAVEAAPEAAAEAVAEAAAAEEAPAEEGKPKPDVDLSAQAGAIWLHGNTKSINANGAVHFGISHMQNKFTLDFGGSYGRGVVADSGSDEWVEIAKKVGGALRYDRFLIPDVNSIYVGGGAMHDPLAGFLLQARGDVGYAHQLVNNEKHKLAVEGGFNYTRDQFMEPPAGAGGGQNFFGGRIAGAYALNVNDNFGFTQSVEALLGGRENQDADEQGFDGKIISDTGLSGALSSFLSVRFGFQLSYDFVPPKKADGTSFESLDTTTSITLVATFM